MCKVRQSETSAEQSVRDASKACAEQAAGNGSGLDADLASGNASKACTEQRFRNTAGIAGGMERADQICAHPRWQKCVRDIAKAERTRQFCRHDTVHFLDVARLAQIENLERGLGIEKELIYAAALLHDIGRQMQYEKGIPHDEASVMLAEGLLTECGFSEAERTEILGAIAAHREPKTRFRDDLAGVLYRADKQSRMCMFCGAEPECDWSEEKKNLHLRR